MSNEDHVSNDHLKNFLEMPRDNLSISERGLLAGLEGILSAKGGKKDQGLEIEILAQAQIILVEWLSKKDALTKSEKILVDDYWDALADCEVECYDMAFIELNYEESDSENNIWPGRPVTRRQAVAQFLADPERLERRTYHRLDDEMVRLGLKKPPTRDELEMRQKSLANLEARLDPFRPKPI